MIRKLHFVQVKHKKLKKKKKKKVTRKTERNLISQFSIDQEFLLTDQICFSIDWTGIENRSSYPKTLWWISSVFRSIENSFQSIGFAFRSIEQELRVDWVIQKLRNGFIEYFDQSRTTFDRSKELFFEISLSVKT